MKKLTESLVSTVVALGLVYIAFKLIDSIINIVRG